MQWQNEVDQKLDALRKRGIKVPEAEDYIAETWLPSLMATQVSGSTKEYFWIMENLTKVELLERFVMIRVVDILREATEPFVR